jgi:hypothetical protein
LALVVWVVLLAIAETAMEIKAPTLYLVQSVPLVADTAHGARRVPTLAEAPVVLAVALKTAITLAVFLAALVIKVATLQRKVKTEAGQMASTVAVVHPPLEMVTLAPPVVVQAVQAHHHPSLALLLLVLAAEVQTTVLAVLAVVAMVTQTPPVVLQVLQILAAEAEAEAWVVLVLAAQAALAS